jgi:hypothetical protein
MIFSQKVYPGVMPPFLPQSVNFFEIQLSHVIISLFLIGLVDELLIDNGHLSVAYT